MCIVKCNKTFAKRKQEVEAGQVVDAHEIKPIEFLDIQKVVDSPLVSETKMRIKDKDCTYVVEHGEAINLLSQHLGKSQDKDRGI